MKKVKIILGVIVTLSVLFFSIGIFVDKIEYAKTVVIEKPIVEVFCEERDHRGLNGDVLGSILANNSENSVDFEDLRD